MNKSDIAPPYERIREKIDRGSFGEKFICVCNNTPYFLKKRSKDLSDWCLNGLQKEYQICSNISIDQVPTAHHYYETHDCCGVLFEYINTDGDVEVIYTNKDNYETFIADLNTFLTKLHDASPSDDGFSYLEGQTHLEDTYLHCREYMHHDRLDGGVYFSDTEYETYADLLDTATETIINNYDKTRETLIHGDIHNPQNLLCTPEGELVAVADWELSGWFDRLFDLAAVEAIYIDRPAAYWPSETIKHRREEFRRNHGVPTEEIPIYTAYKTHVQYMQLEVYNAHSDIDLTGNRTPEKEQEYIRTRLSESKDIIAQLTE